MGRPTAAWRPRRTPITGKADRKFDAVVFRPITDADTRVAETLAGGVNVPSGAAEVAGGPTPPAFHRTHGEALDPQSPRPR